MSCSKVMCSRDEASGSNLRPLCFCSYFRLYLFNSAVCLLSRITATSQRQTSLLWASLYCWQLVQLHCHKMEMSGTAWERGSSPNCRRSLRLPSEAYSRYLLWPRRLNQSRNSIQLLPTWNDTSTSAVCRRAGKKTLLLLFVTVVTGSRPDEASFSSGSLQARGAEGREDREARCSATQRA